MASILSMAHETPTIDLETEVIIGARWARRRISLVCSPPCDASPGASSLLVAINPTIDLPQLRYPSVQRYRLGTDTYWLQLPSWMEAPSLPEAWSSQSISGALYPSRTDLRSCFGVPGVVLLQVLRAESGIPCLTSRHEHYQTREVFEPLDDAQQTEYRQGDGRWRTLRRRLEVEPHTRHQLRRVEPGFSVVLIQMYGATRIDQGPLGPMLDMSDHIYG